MFYAMAFAHYAIYKYSWGLGTVSVMYTKNYGHYTQNTTSAIADSVYFQHAVLWSAAILLFSTSAVQAENS